MLSVLLFKQKSSITVDCVSVEGFLLVGFKYKVEYHVVFAYN